MTGFDMKQEFRSGVPMVELDIITEAKPPNGEEPRIFRVTGIIDTGSPDCIVNTGVLPDYFFLNGLPSQSFLAFSGMFDDCRGATMGLWFMDHCKNAFSVPVFEKSLGFYAPSEPFVLLGRSFLNFGTFTYDGPSKMWKWAYAPKVIRRVASKGFTDGEFHDFLFVAARRSRRINWKSAEKVLREVVEKFEAENELPNVPIVDPVTNKTSVCSALLIHSQVSASVRKNRSKFPMG